MRAQGLAGAFVAVADDGSAIYWNPSGLATGDFFSLAVEHQRAATGERQPLPESRGTATSVFVGTPPLGIGYYRLATAVVQRGAAGTVTASTLTTHHVPITLLQSIGDLVNVGVSLKAVRGVAGRGTVPAAGRDAALDAAADLLTAVQTRFDLDLGLMVRTSRVRAGFVVRNVTEPSFDPPDEAEALTLKRQARAGVAVFPREGLTLSLDADLTTASVPSGRRRDLAAGAEQRLGARLIVRGGVRVQTIDDLRPAPAVGGSVALTPLIWVDAQATLGGDDVERGWGLGIRVSF